MKIKSTSDLPAHTRVFSEIGQWVAAYQPWPILERVRKTYATSMILWSKRHIDIQKINYLIALLDNLTIPVFVKKNVLITCTQEYLERKIDPSFFLEPVVEFCVWYSLFVLDKSPIDLLDSVHKHVKHDVSKRENCDLRSFQHRGHNS